MLAAFNFINFPLVSTLINFCGKAFSLLAFMAKVINKSNRDQNGWEKLPYAHTKAYLQSNAKERFSYAHLTFLLAFLSQGYQQWKFWSFWLQLLVLATLAMNTNGQSYVIWSLPLSNLWHPLCKQEFVLWDASVAMGLEVRIYSYIDRKLMARRYESEINWYGCLRPMLIYQPFTGR